MKKILSFIMVFMVALMWNATGYSADQYISGNVGIVWMDDADAEFADFHQDGYTFGFDSGVTFTGAYGCDFGDYRLEAEMGYQSSDLATAGFFVDGELVDFSPMENPMDIVGDLSLTTYMVNFYYDIALGNGGVELSPYVGVGHADITADGLNFVDGPAEYDFKMSEGTHAYQLGAVLSLPVGDNIMLDVRYRYFGTGTMTFIMPHMALDSDLYMFNMSGESHSALIGLRVTL